MPFMSALAACCCRQAKVTFTGVLSGMRLKQRLATGTVYPLWRCRRVDQACVRRYAVVLW